MYNEAQEGPAKEAGLKPAGVVQSTENRMNEVRESARSVRLHARRAEGLRQLTTRIRNVPLRKRVAQLTNTALTPLLCRPFKLIHVVEHPKCGGTWIRRMIQTYNGSAVYLGERLQRPGDVIQVHRLYRRSYWRPIVLVRDPRDLYVSFYYHETHYQRREKNLAIERYFRHEPSRPL